MRPLGFAGIALIAVGIIVLAMRGISYTKDRETVEVGPIKVSAEEKGFVPPWAGGLAIVVGAVLVFAGRGKRA